MTWKQSLTTLAAFHLALLPGMAQAQSSSFDQAYARQGTEARFSLTIPLGDSSDKTKSAPRLNFGLRNYTDSSTASTDWMRATQPDYREVRLGFTLGETPQFLLNDNLILMSNETEGEKKEGSKIGTAGKIGLGVAAVALATVAVVGVVVLTCDSDSNSCLGDDF